MLVAFAVPSTLALGPAWVLVAEDGFDSPVANDTWFRKSYNDGSAEVRDGRMVLSLAEGQTGVTVLQVVRPSPTGVTFTVDVRIADYGVFVATLGALKGATESGQLAGEWVGISAWETGALLFGTRDGAASEAPLPALAAGVDHRLELTVRPDGRAEARVATADGVLLGAASLADHRINLTESVHEFDLAVWAPTARVEVDAVRMDVVAPDVPTTEGS